MKRPAALGPVLRELSAMATQARHLPLDLAPSEKDGSGPAVVLLHGLYASAGVWRPLRGRLQRRLAAATYSFSYAPGPGIVELSERLAALIRTVEGQRPIVLVGHSLGGLVMRYYASRDGCDARVVLTISLAAPFLGTRRNWLVPGQAGRDIAAGAPILDDLRRRSAANERIPHLAILAEEDEMIEPGAYPDYGRHGLAARIGHNGILFHAETLERVERAVAAATDHHRSQRPFG